MYDQNNVSRFVGKENAYLTLLNKFQLTQCRAYSFNKTSDVFLMLDYENCHIPERGDLRSKETVSKSLRIDTIKLEK